MGFTFLLFVIPSMSMTRVTIMCITMAKPQSDRTTIATLEINMVTAMFLALGDSSYTSNLRSTFRANKFFRFELFFLQLILFAVFHTAKVRLLTLETHIVSTFVQSELL